MPKRHYPFENDFRPQMKIHVGEKEIANGVGQASMLRVYGTKT